jgi:hypothetical protein
MEERHTICIMRTLVEKPLKMRRLWENLLNTQTALRTLLTSTAEGDCANFEEGEVDGGFEDG